MTNLEKFHMLIENSDFIRVNEELVGQWQYIGHDNSKKVMDAHGDDDVFKCHFYGENKTKYCFSLTKSNIEEGNFSCGSCGMFVLHLDVRKETNLFDIQFCKEINLLEIIQFYD